MTRLSQSTLGLVAATAVLTFACGATPVQAQCSSCGTPDGVLASDRPTRGDRSLFASGDDAGNRAAAAPALVSGADARSHADEPLGRQQQRVGAAADCRVGSHADGANRRASRRRLSYKRWDSLQRRRCRRLTLLHQPRLFRASRPCSGPWSVSRRRRPPSLALRSSNQSSPAAARRAVRASPRHRLALRAPAGRPSSSKRVSVLPSRPSPPPGDVRRVPSRLASHTTGRALAFRLRRRRRR
jgi:hypothetical protein